MSTVARIFAEDVSVWTDDAAVGEKIANRLGWLNAVEFARQHQTSLQTLVDDIGEQGFTHVLLLGMGGSCLAAEVFDRLRPADTAGLPLVVLDSTCPEQVLAAQQQVTLETTLVLVASKSGGTLETRLLCQYFLTQIQALSGKQAGRQFIAITDQGSQLQALAEEAGFLHCLLNPADIGGRFSALSYFGLLPAALAGWSLEQLLQRAEQAVIDCREETGLGVQLGQWLLAGYADKRIDKLLLQVPDSLRPLVGWIEQLVAESLGKLGQGMLPILLHQPNTLSEIGRAHV